ncbi:VTC domain-containing protein [Umbelopsis sp. AD052]|nr:VTC domain-containing protein [Umbelopsis sp. AD052]
MKFGATLEHLQVKGWEEKYVAYNSIKKLLKSPSTAEENHSFGEAEEEDFVEQLDSELEKVNSFHSQQMQEIQQSIDDCTKQIDEINQHEDITVQQSNLDEIAERVNHLADWINNLANYAQVNYTAIIKLVKKHDRHVQYHVRPLFMIRLKQCPFWKQDYEGLLLRLSDLFGVIRSEISPVSALSASYAQPEQHSTETFLRKSTKYFVSLDNVLELKTFILRHLPMLVYDNATRKSNKGINPPITSIYLDNSELELYNAKVDKEDGAQVIRLRWYGSTEDTNKIYIERKVQQEEDAGELKDRFMLKEKYIKDFLDGRREVVEKNVRKIRAKSADSNAEADAFEKLAYELQDAIKSKNLQPMARTYYSRTAFQIPGDSRHRLSLDTNLTMIREDDHLFPDDPTSRRPNGEWRRPDVDVNFPFSELPPDDVRRFPYAVLEIKLNLPPGSRTPAWIDELISSGLVEEAPKFSKFVHATAILFERRVHLLPFWLAQMESEEEATLIVQENANVIHALSRKYSQKSVEVAMQNSQSISKMTPANEPANITNATGRASPDVLVGRQVEPSSSRTINVHHAKSSSSTLPTKSAKSWFNVISSKLPFNHLNGRYQDEVLCLPPGVHIPQKISTPVRVEPKVFFANERTYFSWMTFAVLLGSFSVALVNTGDKIGKIAGLMYTMISLSTLIYGYGLYYRRHELIMARASGPYDDVVGPTVICFALLIAVAINAYLKLA